MPPAPTGSRTKIRTDIFGSPCPHQVRFSRVHGPDPAVCDISFLGNVDVTLGQSVTVQVGVSSYTGLVVKFEKDSSESDTSPIVNLKLTDWRDRLLDEYIYAQFNMTDEKGRTWHLPPEDWPTQKYTYVGREVGQLDFLAAQAGNAVPLRDLVHIYGYVGLLSAFTILQGLSVQFNFTWDSDLNAKIILKKSYPWNIDWSHGMRGSEAIEDLLHKCGLQWTTRKPNEIYVTHRGTSSSPMVYGYLNDSTDFCAVGAMNANKGKAISDKGRYVDILGERNQYESYHPCAPNWPPIWDWMMTYSQLMSVHLAVLGLTWIHKIRDLPPQYHDHETWEDPVFAWRGDQNYKKSRMDMTISDYVNQIPFRVYIVDPNWYCPIRDPASFKESVDHKWVGKLYQFDKQTLSPRVPNQGMPPPIPINFENYQSASNALWNSQDLNSEWEPSGHLVTESNAQYSLFATTMSVHSHHPDPLRDQKCNVPLSKGHTLSVEEVLDRNINNPAGAKAGYRIRVTFNDCQVWKKYVLPENYDKAIDADAIQHDVPIIGLSFDREIYHKRVGTPGGIQARGIRHTVRGLHKGFLLEKVPGDPEEKRIMRDNFRRNLLAGGAVPEALPVKADVIAIQIGKQLLNHSAITTAGGMNFDAATGLHPDGVIESVQVTWNPDTAAREAVRFTEESIDVLDLAAPSAVRLSTKRKTDEDLIRDLLMQEPVWKHKQQSTLGKMRSEPPVDNTKTSAVPEANAVLSVGNANGKFPSIQANLTISSGSISANNIDYRQNVSSSNTSDKCLIQIGVIEFARGSLTDKNNRLPEIVPHTTTKTWRVTDSQFSSLATEKEKRQAVVKKMMDFYPVVSLTTIGESKMAQVIAATGVSSSQAAVKATLTFASSGNVWMYGMVMDGYHFAPIESGKPVSICIAEQLGWGCVTGINPEWDRDEYLVIGISRSNYSGTGPLPRIIQVELLPPPLESDLDIFGYPVNGVPGSTGEGASFTLGSEELELITFDSANKAIPLFDASGNRRKQRVYNMVSGAAKPSRVRPVRASKGINGRYFVDIEDCDPH